MQFVVDREIAWNSGVVRNLLEDFSEDNPTIPFMNVRGKILEKVIEFMTYHHNHPFLLGDDKEKDSTANGFRVCEKIFRFALLPNSFTVGEELSAKQEMMRHKIVEKYSQIISSLFEN